MKSAARLAFCHLAIIGLVAAGQFNFLARDASSSSSSSSSISASQSSNSSITATASLSAASSNGTLSSSSSRNASSISNATITSSSSSSSTSSPTPAPSPKTDDEAADVAKQCHRGDSKMDSSNSSPFCYPEFNATVYVGNTTYFIWDYEEYHDDATNQITLRYANYVQNNDTISQVSASGKQGWAKIEMQQDWLKGNKSTNLTFFMSSTDPIGSDSNPRSGLQFTLLEKDTGSSSKKPNKLGIGLGIPFAFALVALGIAGIFFYMRRRRRAGGYLNKRSGSHGGGGGGGRDRGVHLDDDDWSGGTRGPERFRDEPGPGLELQDRGRGHGRDDSLGSLGSSPTHDGFESQGPSGGNAFRDEISRQRDKNR